MMSKRVKGLKKRIEGGAFEDIKKFQSSLRVREKRKGEPFCFAMVLNFMFEALCALNIKN